MARGARFSKMVSWLLSEVDQIAHSLTSRIYSIRPVSSQVETSIDGRLISINGIELRAALGGFSFATCIRHFRLWHF
jgi:hypothetical protein